MNVWVSALISPAGTPAALMRKLEDHILITSEDMLEKVQRVLRYNRIADRYNVTPGMAKEYVENIRASAVLVAANLPDTPIVEADPSDDMFLVCASNGRADCIVSGDRHLLRLAVYQGAPNSFPSETADVHRNLYVRKQRIPVRGLKHDEGSIPSLRS